MRMMVTARVVTIKLLQPKDSLFLNLSEVKMNLRRKYTQSTPR